MDTKTLHRLWPDAAEQLTNLFRALYPDLAARCNGRLERAAEIMCRVDARQQDLTRPGVYLVRSESNSRGWYEVDINLKTCTCPDAGKHPDIICKHRLAIGLDLHGPEWIERGIRGRCCALSQIQKELAQALDELAEYGARLEEIAIHEAAGIPQDDAAKEAARLVAAQAQEKADALAQRRSQTASLDVYHFVNQ